MVRNPTQAQNWLLVVAAMLCLAVGANAIVQSTFGLFATSLTQDFDWSRTSFSLVILISNAAAALGMPVIGYLIDRYDQNIILPSCICLFAIAVSGASMASSIVGFSIIYAAIGLFGAGLSPVPYAKIIGAAFDRQRGLALGIGLAGVGVGTALVPLLTQFLISEWSWRVAYSALGGLVAMIALPAALYLARRSTIPSAQPVDAEGLSARQSLRSSEFWTLVAAFTLIPMAVNGTLLHVVPLLVDQGISIVDASRIISVAGISMIAGRIVSGWLFDRYFAPYVSILLLVPVGLGILLLNFQTGTAAAILGVALVAAGLGAEADMLAYLQSRYLGLRAFGQIFGYLFAVVALASGIGPYLMALSYDLTGSYKFAALGFYGSLAVSCLLLGRLGPYRYPPPRQPQSAAPEPGEASRNHLGKM